MTRLLNFTRTQQRGRDLCVFEWRRWGFYVVVVEEYERKSI